MINIFKKIFLIIGNKKIKFILLSLGSLLSSFLDIIGIGMIGPLIASFLNPELVQNFFSKHALNFEILKIFNNDNTIYIFCVLVLSAFTLKSLVSYLINKKIIHVGFEIQEELRNDFLQIFQNLSYENFLKKKTSELLHAINHLTIVFCQNTVVKIFVLLSETIIFISVLVFLFFVNMKITILIFMTMSFIYLFYYFYIRKRMDKYGNILGESDQQFLEYGKITMDGFKEIKILQKEDYFFDEYKKINKQFANAHMNYDTTLILPKFLLESSIIVVIMILTISVVIISGNNTNSISIIGIFAVSAARIIPIVYNIFNSIASIIGSKYSIDKISILLKDKNNNAQKTILDKKNENFSFNNIKFENLSFSYKESEEILNKVNFTIDPGDFIGIAGESGSGKTTLVNLLIGLLKPTTGRILLNNEDLNNNILNWQSNISYISQQNFVYGASILENITLEKNKQKINFDLLDESIQMAHLTNFINSLDKKYESIISDKVLNISGGQKQRIALARSFYFRRNFIVLDESLNALQEDLQEKILKDIINASKKITLIIISHSKKNLNLCNYILQVKNKKIEKIYPK